MASYKNTKIVRRDSKGFCPPLITGLILNYGYEYDDSTNAAWNLLIIIGAKIIRSLETYIDHRRSYRIEVGIALPEDLSLYTFL